MPPSGAATNAEPSTMRSPASAPTMSGLRRQQRYAEPGAALQPRARPVARVAIEGVHALEDLEHRAGADLVAPAQRPVRIGEAQSDREVDVGRTGNALLGDVAGEIDDR